MSNADFEARLARLRQSEGAPHRRPTPPRTPPRTYRDRLERALAAAAAAGITEKDCFPPLMRALSAMGIPVRPLHFKSNASLFSIGLALGLGCFGGVLAIFHFDLLPAPSRGPVAGLLTLGWPGVAAMSLGIGLAFAAIIRAKANRARLPHWQDL